MLVCARTSGTEGGQDTSHRPPVALFACLPTERRLAFSRAFLSAAAAAAAAVAASRQVCISTAHQRRPQCPLLQPRLRVQRPSVNCAAAASTCQAGPEFHRLRQLRNEFEKLRLPTGLIHWRELAKQGVTASQLSLERFDELFSLNLSFRTLRLQNLISF